MGYAITWCAVREDAAERFLEEIGLSRTGDSEEVPESLVSTARLETGWRVLWYNRYGCPFLRSDDLAALSRERDVVVCRIEEHVMASSSELWSRGRRSWSLSHEGEAGPRGLSTEGVLPDCFASIREEMEQLQRAAGGDDADVDHIFEIPLKVAEALVGFKHDESWPITGEQFMVLKPPPGKGLLGRLFGRG